MKIKLIGSPEIVMSNFDSKHNAFAWPTVTQLKNGKLAVAASGFRRRHVCPFGKTVISFSENEGKTWSLPTPVIDTVLDDRDGGICAFGESSLIVTSFNLDVNKQREINETYTENGWMDWDTQPKEMGKYINAYLDTITDEDAKKYRGVTYRISHDNGVTFGKIMKAPLTSPHGPTVLNDGTVLWVGSKDSQVQAYRLCEDNSFEFVGKVEPVHIGEKSNNCEPHAIQLKDGRIICHIRLQPPFTIFQSVSEDNGKTWSKPERVLDDNEGAPSHIIELDDGTLVATYSRRQSPYGIRAMFSLDGGKTWDKDYELYRGDDNIDVGYPSTVKLADGNLLTVFYSQPDNTQPTVIMQQKWTFEK